jgi:phosphoglycerol transferase MdoB-like AlkP superfamily enzyme
MSQIDVMPTLFGLLNFSYESKFYGQDVLKPDYKPRAFIATYQNLGLIKDQFLTILSPKQDVKQYQLELVNNPKLQNNFQINYEEKKVDKIKDNLVKETISYYQTASESLKKKAYQN